MGRRAVPLAPHPKFQVARAVTVSVSRVVVFWTGCCRRRQRHMEPALPCSGLVPVGSGSSNARGCLLALGVCYVAAAVPMLCRSAAICGGRGRRLLPRPVSGVLFTSSGAGIWRRTTCMWSVKESNVRPGPFWRLAAFESNSNGDRNRRRPRHRVACNGNAIRELSWRATKDCMPDACRARPAVPTATPTPRRAGLGEQTNKTRKRNRMETPWPHEAMTAARAGRRRRLVPPANE